MTVLWRFFFFFCILVFRVYDGRIKGIGGLGLGIPWLGGFSLGDQEEGQSGLEKLGL